MKAKTKYRDLKPNIDHFQKDDEFRNNYISVDWQPIPLSLIGNIIKNDYRLEFRRPIKAKAVKR